MVSFSLHDVSYLNSIYRQEKTQKLRDFQYCGLSPDLQPPVSNQKKILCAAFQSFDLDWCIFNPCLFWYILLHSHLTSASITSSPASVNCTIYLCVLEHILDVTGEPVKTSLSFFPSRKTRGVSSFLCFSKGSCLQASTASWVASLLCPSTSLILVVV